MQPAVGGAHRRSPPHKGTSPAAARSASSIPAPRRCHGNVYPAGLGWGARERSAQGWRGARAVCDPGPGEQNPGPVLQYQQLNPHSLGVCLSINPARWPSAYGGVKI